MRKSKGWYVCYTGIQDAVHNLYELQKDDDAGIFRTDDEAIQFVAWSALGGDDEAIKAIKYLIKHSPNEIDSMFRRVLDEQTFKTIQQL